MMNFNYECLFIIAGYHYDFGTEKNESQIYNIILFKIFLHSQSVCLSLYIIVYRGKCISVCARLVFFSLRRRFVKKIFHFIMSLYHTQPRIGGNSYRQKQSLIFSWKNIFLRIYHLRCKYIPLFMLLLLLSSFYYSFYFYLFFIFLHFFYFATSFRLGWNNLPFWRGSLQYIVHILSRGPISFIVQILVSHFCF